MRLDALDRKRIGPLQNRFELRKRGNHGRDRLTVVTVGCRFAESVDAIIVGQSENHVTVMRVTAARDHERMRGVELDCLVRELHPAATAGVERAVRAILNSLCAPAVARKPIRASASVLPRSNRLPGFFSKHFITICDICAGIRESTTSGATAVSVTCL